MKHTQGKWEVDPESDGQLWISVEDSTTPICKINQAEEEDGNIVTTEEDKANANLIASAPELLEAIKSAMRIKDLWVPPEDHHSDENAHEIKALRLMELAFEEVIKKATA